MDCLTQTGRNAAQTGESASVGQFKQAGAVVMANPSAPGALHDKLHRRDRKGPAKKHAD